ncbi:GNAT family N-acetyltransferase [Paenibacillus sp. BIHB 4019]|uniref:GNAT family N-acetyltransferase n=1 Tax=Paenibacillus sp. BIHB 4019 TaxID=1870819 RepID=A0A1B2DKS0_9BACL|nr:GNAT family N-acetyltransferase [Paenibacillus sp. BIHB 4019]ANY68302.1 GNAT family N-acetyltransferase [Paenibacillus sp. BIHB 4019]
MSFKIRLAEKKDISSLTDLMHDYIVGFYQNPWPGTPEIHQLMEQLLEKQGGIQFVVEKEQQLIGFATLYFTISTMKSAQITLMNDFFLLEPYRDTEVEEELFLTCRTYTQEQGFAHMFWITAPQNKRAQQFFAKMDAVQGSWVNYTIV